MANFYEDLARGRQGEVLVTKALREMGHTVEDVTKDSDYWKKDIDLIVDGGTLEVKSDWNMGKTGNIVLEMRKREDGKDGWFRQTAADNLAFVDMQNRICYIIKTKELRDYVEGVITSVAQGGYVCGVKDKTLNGYWCLLINVNNLDFYKMAV